MVTGIQQLCDDTLQALGTLDAARLDELAEVAERLRSARDDDASASCASGRLDVKSGGTACMALRLALTGTATRLQVLRGLSCGNGAIGGLHRWDR